MTDYYTFNNRMTLFVCSACTRKCPQCMQRSLLKSYYQMSLNEVNAFITASRGHQFEQVAISGGEPLLWHWLLTGVRMLKEASVAKEISIFSNGMHPERVTPKLMQYVDKLRLSYYDDNGRQLRELKDKYGDKVGVVDRRQHFPIPTRLLDDVLPAECNCGGYMVYNKFVYACPQVPANMAEFGLGGFTESYCNIEPGYLAKLSYFPRQNHTLCRGCLANLKVRDRLKA